MAFSDTIISQCDSNVLGSKKDIYTLGQMLKLMKAGFVKYLLAIISMSLALSGFDAITAFLLKKIIVRAENYGDINIFQGLLQETLRCVAAGLICLFIYAISFYIYTMEAKKGGANLQKMLYSKCLRLPYSYYENNSTSDFMSKLIYDCERACGIYGSRFRRIIMPFLMTCFYLTVMFLFSWQLTLCLLGVSIVLFMINSAFITPMQRVSGELSETNVSIIEGISNILSGIEQIKMFSLKSVMVDKYVNSNNKFRKQQGKMNIMAAMLDGLNQLFELMGSLVFIALGVFFVSKQITTVGNLAAIYLLYGAMSYNMLQVGLYIPSMAGYLANAKRVFRFLETEEEPESYPEGGNITQNPLNEDYEVCIRNVSFSYDDRYEILQGFNLDIPKGKCVAIKGESGKGKSTIAKLLLGMYPVKSGKIYIEGKSIEDYRLSELRDKIAYVPQEPYLYDVSIEENIRYGRLDANKADIINAAKQANAHDFILQMENGYDTRAGARGNCLSGGQRQRIAIARAFLKNAPILILDEATAALDHKAEQQVIEALERLKSGKTTIVIAHRQSTYEHADEIISI